MTDLDADATTQRDDDERFSNPMTEPSLGDVIAKRYHRRSVLRGSLAASVMTALTAPLATTALFAGSRPAAAAGTSQSPFDFGEISHGVDETHHVAPGYDADILIRWGDPVTADAPPFDPRNQTAEAQEKQFGYNNDYIGYIPLPFGSDNGEHGLLCVNHEYTNEEGMFPGIDRQDLSEFFFADMTKDMVDVEMAAHGGSVIEIRKTDGKWQVVPNSRYARRISARSTEMRVAGPAAGHPRLQTSADPSGTRVLGTLNNCAGGVTPWGTYLMAEENFHHYFWVDPPEAPADGSAEAPEPSIREDHPERANYTRYGIPKLNYAWGKFHDRFHVDKEPNEANRFGWIVEVDPFDPSSVPVKRTALGRFKHEGAETIVNKDGRVVVYSGDDERFDYLYRFVTAGRVDPGKPGASRDLLDSGTLFVARFDADGSMTWMPLVFGSGPLTPENGFESQADVLIETRRAADLLGATPMDRPEDVQPNPVTQKVFVMLTNNAKRVAEDVDTANPRGPNPFGHIVELTPPDGDHAALTFRWDVLVQCGDPSVAEVGAVWNPETSQNGWFASPDNCAIDSEGRLWVSTDQGRYWDMTGTADGLWAVETEGEGRGTGRMFFRVPVGAELCGPTFAPDDRSLFLAVQHPAMDGAEKLKGFERRTTFDDPVTRWPDFDPNTPPRPSVVAITKSDGGPIGS